MTKEKLDILYLERGIEDNLFWLNSGSMSNPKRIKYRKRALRKARKELKQLTKQKYDGIMFQDELQKMLGYLRENKPL